MCHLPFLYNVGIICCSSNILQTPSTHLWGIFVPLKATPLHQHLNFMAFGQYNCLEAVVLKSTTCLLVLLLVLNMQQIHVPLAPQDQAKVIWKFWPSQQPSCEPHSLTYRNFQIIPTTCTIIYKNNISHVGKHLQMYYLQGFICLHFPSFGNIVLNCPKLLSLDGSFTYQWMCVTMNVVMVQLTH